MSIKKRKVNKSSERASDLKDKATEEFIEKETSSDLSSKEEYENRLKDKSIEKILSETKTTKESSTNNQIDIDTQSNNEINNSRSSYFISVALVILNFMIFILLFSLILFILNFVFTRIRIFFSEHAI